MDRSSLYSFLIISLSLFLSLSIDKLQSFRVLSFSPSPAFSLVCAKDQKTFRVINLITFFRERERETAGLKATRYPTPKQRLISSYRYLLLLSSANSLSGCVLTNAFVPGRGTALLSRSKLRGIVLARVSVFPLFIPNAPRLHRVTGNNRRSKYGHRALYRY